MATMTEAAASYQTQMTGFQTAFQDGVAAKMQAFLDAVASFDAALPASLAANADVGLQAAYQDAAGTALTDLVNGIYDLTNVFDAAAGAIIEAIPSE